MGILTHWISAREARLVARLLKRMGYRVTIKQCRNYVNNVAEWCEPDPHVVDTKRKIARAIAVEIGLQPAE